MLSSIAQKPIIGNNTQDLTFLQNSLLGFWEYYEDKENMVVSNGLLNIISILKT